jgi:hypothetical protein
MQFQIRYYRSDMAEYRRRQPREMSDIERVETRDFGSRGGRIPVSFVTVTY